MRCVLSAVALLAALILEVAAAHAMPLTFTGTLSGASEVPPNNSQAAAVAGKSSLRRGFSVRCL